MNKTTTSNSDTLFNVSDQAVNIFESIREGGLGVAVGLLEVSPSDMGMEDETARLLAVEVLCAACGQPSTSEECEHIQEWCEKNPADADPTIQAKMLTIVDAAVAEGGDEAVAEKMRERIKSLV